MANRKISDLTALTTPASGDYLPIVDISEAAAADKNKRITVEELLRGAPNGTAGAPGIAFESDGGNGFYLAGTDTIGASTNGVNRLTLSTSALTSTVPISATSFTPTSSTIPTNGVYLPSANNVAISSNGIGRLFISDDGKIGIGTSTPSNYTSLADNLVIVGAAHEGITIISGVSQSGNIYFGDADAEGRGRIVYQHNDDSLRFWTAGVERLHITSTGQIQSAGLGSAASPALSFTTDTNTGIYSPGADQVAISTNGTGRLFVSSAGKVGIGESNIQANLHVAANISDATALTWANSQLSVATPIAGNSTANRATIYFAPYGSDNNYAPAAISSTAAASGASTLKFFTNPSGNTTGDISSYERLRITSDGKLGLGTSSPGYLLDVAGDSRISGTNGLRIEAGGTGTQLYNNSGGTVLDSFTASTSLRFLTQSTERARIDSSGRLGVGTTSPGDYNASADDLVVASSGSTGITIASNSANYGSIFFADGTTGDAEYAGYLQYNHADNSFAFGSSANEAFRIDSSRRLLVGTSTARSAWNNATIGSNLIQIERSGDGLDAALSICANSGTSSPDITAAILYLGKTRGTASGATTAVASGDCLGRTSFQGSDGTEQVEAAKIEAFVDGTPGANDMPGRLVFSTTADGAASPTERMRISANGILDTFGSSGVGVGIRNSQTAANNLYLLRGFYSATSTLNGTISVTIATNGDLANTNNVYGAISDIKLKENIVDANSQWDDIKALRPVNYNFKEGQTHTQLGLIAQEVELVSPGLVSESPDRDEDGNDLGTVTKSVNYSVLYMKAVKALQEAMERIETLEAKVAALETP